MERRDSPQESHGLCYRLFRLIMNSLAFQSLKRIALRHPGDQYVPVSTFHQNKDHSVADGSSSTSKNLIDVKKDGKFGNENTTLTAVEAANGHKAIIRKKGGGDDRERLNGKVNDVNIIPIKIPGMVDKGAPTEDRGATVPASTSKVTQVGDANTVVIIHGDASKRDDGKNNTHLTIDEKAEQFIKKKRASHSRTHTTNESKSGGPQKKKPHP
eukprot:TRINITY_DN7101_c2_g1_i1.p1 TRINITY_DN7101_c2_g1~~TRINITY_DN7101_c2_g1_i1.p1  ORF type:complete len:226 (-),score=44.22 TRINITY_DN7101_c2_g1_i1:287-925(-)